MDTARSCKTGVDAPAVLSRLMNVVRGTGMAQTPRTVNIEQSRPTAGADEYSTVQYSTVQDRTKVGSHKQPPPRTIS